VQRAEHGDPVAQFTLGSSYANGRGVPPDYRQAVKWYYLSARQGYAPAQYRLGFCYARGLGTPQNLAAAVGWYRRAAEQGNAAAEYSLGLCYLNGRGVAPDRVQANQWFRLAAAHGYRVPPTVMTPPSPTASATPPATPPAASPANPPPEADPGNELTVDEIKSLSSAGVKADTLIGQIKSSNSKFTPQDIAAAQQANVDPAVIECMKANPR
jgi:hypothetical protein